MKMNIIETLKNKARDANKLGDNETLRSIIKELDQIWLDDRAAECFYTELEHYHEEEV